MFIWTMHDAAGALAAILAFGCLGISSALRYVRQRKCKHAHWFETRQCDAVCRDCHKNLGFVGDWRKK